MELLLILSALLSTLTGVVTGTRAPALQVQNCAIAADTARVVAMAPLPPASGHRHLLGGFDGRARSRVVEAAAVVVTAAPRLYLDRPRA